MYINSQVMNYQFKRTFFLLVCQIRTGKITWRILYSYIQTPIFHDHTQSKQVYAAGGETQSSCPCP
jgi:hypothetical protein